MRTLFGFVVHLVSVSMDWGFLFSTPFPPLSSIYIFLVSCRLSFFLSGCMFVFILFLEFIPELR